VVAEKGTKNNHINMDKKIANKLIKKYPNLFEVDVSNPTPYSQRGIECGDGWYPLLDNALRLINNHTKNPPFVEEPLFKLKVAYNKIFWNRVFAPLGKLIIRGIPTMYPATESHKYENRWKIYYKWQDIFKAVPKYVKPNNKLVVRVEQIKEKFGTLRLSLSGGDSYVYGVVALAESLSFSICEECGANQNVQQNTKGWIKTLCGDCRKKQKD
jgi:hypothetical protein